MSQSSASPVVRAADLSFELDAEGGVFHLLSPQTGSRIASSLECAVRLADRTVRSRGTRAIWRPLAEEEGEGLEIRFQPEEDIHLGLTVRVDELSGGLAFTASVTSGDRPCSPRELTPISTGDSGALDFCPNYGDISFFRSGWLDWEPAHAVRARSSDVDPTQVESFLVSGLHRVDSGDTLVLGFQDATRQFSRIRLVSRKGAASVSAGVETGWGILAPGETITAESLWVGYGGDASLLLLAYGLFRGRGRADARQPVIWDSWFPGFEQTTERQFLDALDELESRLPDVDTVIIGDGYQLIHNDGPGIGDWLDTNHQFPHGLGWLAEQIRKRGFQPGLWLAPFLVGESSQFYKYYADAVVRTREPEGTHWREMWRGDRVFYLDTTHPDARHFIRDIFENLSYRFGYRTFQIDFAYAAAADGFRRDRTATGAQALHRALELIRGTVGPDRYLILSGAPQGAGSGLVDAVRSTPEAGPQWGGACGKLAVHRNLVSRCFIGGGRPALAGAPILLPDQGDSDGELQMLLTAAGLAGGPITLAGRPGGLSTGQMALLQRVLPPYSRAGVALDLFDRTIPQQLAGPIHGPDGLWWIVGVFNTTDEPADRKVDLSRLGWQDEPVHAYEYWQGQYLGLLSHEISLPAIPARSCRLLALHGDLGRPQFLATDGSVLRGATSLARIRWHPGEEGAAGHLAVDLNGEGSSSMILRFAIPERLLARSVQARGGRARIDRQKSSGTLLAVDVSFRDRCSLEIQF